MSEGIIPIYDFENSDSQESSEEYKYSKNAGAGEQPMFISVRAANGSIYQLYYHWLLSREVKLFHDEAKNKKGYVLDLETSNTLLTLYLINFTEADFLSFEHDLQMTRVSRIFEYRGDIESIEIPLIKLHKVYAASGRRPE